MRDGQNLRPRLGEGIEPDSYPIAIGAFILADEIQRTVDSHHPQK
jgi:hypothetical protein